MSLTQIDGFGAEQILGRLVQSAGFKAIKFEPLQLVKTALRFQVGMTRLRKALEHDLNTYVKSNRRSWLHATPKEILTATNWQSVPPQQILDCVFGIDCCINFRGWILGVDATACPEKAEHKLFQLKRGFLKPLWETIGIDYVAVAHITNATLTPTQLVMQLKCVLKGAKLIQL